MDDSQARMLESFLNSFLLPDIKNFITVLSRRLPTKKINKSARKAVMINLLVMEVRRLMDYNNSEVLDVLVELMNQRKFVPIYVRVDRHIEMGRRNSGQDLGSIITRQANLPAASNLSAPIQVKLEYKPSPFYTTHTCLFPTKILPSKFFAFELTAEQQQLFSERCPEDGRSLYEIRFFCTHYDNQPLSRSRPKEVEFPPICEIKINTDHTINGSALRGLKNKPGTTNPADLTFACHLNSRRNNVEFVYANTTKPYAGTIELVKRIPISDIVKKIKETNIISKEKTLKRLQELQDDNDIVLESETISTKCPLGFTRIQTPSRSIHCQHLQCFDATTFLMMNQQTPTWCCPICNRKMESYDEVGVDEYFQDILSLVSESAESIRIEEGGKFKILDEESDGTSDDEDDDDKGKHDTNGGNEKMEPDNSIDHDANDRVTDSVTILDDDSELEEEQQDPDDIPLAKRQKTAPSTSIPSSTLSASSLSSTPSSLAQSSRQAVIDLTLDSDDENDDQDPNGSCNDTDDNTNAQTSPCPPTTTRSPSSTSTTTASSTASNLLPSGTVSQSNGSWPYQPSAPIPNTLSSLVIPLPWYANKDDSQSTNPVQQSNSAPDLSNLALPPLSPSSSP